MPEELAILDADESQFTTLLMQLPSRDFVRKGWIEDEYTPRVLTLASDVIPDDTFVRFEGEMAWVRRNDWIWLQHSGESLLIINALEGCWSVERASDRQERTFAPAGSRAIIVATGIEDLSECRQIYPCGG